MSFDFGGWVTQTAIGERLPGWDVPSREGFFAGGVRATKSPISTQMNLKTNFAAKIVR
jgi:hypothetical protein